MPPPDISSASEYVKVDVCPRRPPFCRGLITTSRSALRLHERMSPLFIALTRTTVKQRQPWHPCFVRAKRMRVWAKLPRSRSYDTYTACRASPPRVSGSPSAEAPRTPISQGVEGCRLEHVEHPRFARRRLLPRDQFSPSPPPGAERVSDQGRRFWRRLPVDAPPLFAGTITKSRLHDARTSPARPDDDPDTSAVDRGLQRRLLRALAREGMQEGPVPASDLLLPDRLAVEHGHPKQTCKHINRAHGLVYRSQAPAPPASQNSLQGGRIRRTPSRLPCFVPYGTIHIV